MTNYDILKEYEAHKTPVPSYEEWLQLNEVIKRTKASGNYPSKVSQYKARITALTEENQQLKELLKDCREFFYENLIDTEFHFSCGLGSDIKKQNCMRSLSKLKTKIDNAVGKK